MQPKLIVGPPNDKYEQEADLVADQVTRMPEPGLQRQVNEEEEEEILQTKSLVQRRVTAKAGGNEAPPIVRDVLRSPGRPLELPTRQYMESRFGHDFSQVRVHANVRAAASARAMNARAYTVGRDVVFGSGEYAPGSREGQRLLAHELTHVVQKNNADAMRPKKSRMLLSPAIRSTHFAIHHDPAARQTIRMKSRNRSLSTPNWNQLPELAKKELAAKGYGKAWFSNKSDRIRLTALNVYVKLRGLHLWEHVGRNIKVRPGTLRIGTDVRKLKKTLRKRPDFTNPEKSLSKWSSREKRARASLHFKHFSGWPEGDVQAHIDKAGLHAGPPIPIIGPIIQFIRHTIDWARDGYQDVYGIRDMLLEQGWWRGPLVVLSKSISGSPSDKG